MTDETDEILADADLMEQLSQSREDIAAGRTVSLEELEQETQSSPGANISLANRGDSNF